MEVRKAKRYFYIAFRFLRLFATLVGFLGIVLVALNVMVGLFGGGGASGEPFTSMVWAEFELWQESGAWVQDACLNAVKFILIPAIIFVVTTVYLRKARVLDLTGR